MIKQTLPYLNIDPKHVSFIDVLSIWKQFENSKSISLPYDTEGNIIRNFHIIPIKNRSRFSITRGSEFKQFGAEMFRTAIR